MEKGLLGLGDSTFINRYDLLKFVDEGDDLYTIGDDCEGGNYVLWRPGETPKYVIANVRGVVECPLIDKGIPEGDYVIKQHPDFPCYWISDYGDMTFRWYPFYNGHTLFHIGELMPWEGWFYKDIPWNCETRFSNDNVCGVGETWAAGGGAHVEIPDPVVKLLLQDQGFANMPGILYEKRRCAGGDSVYSFGQRRADRGKNGLIAQAAISSLIRYEEKLPIGSIVMYYGELDDLPDNWHICDGNEGTKDLRNRFLYCARTQVWVDRTGGAIAHTHDFTETNVPPIGHVHDFTEPPFPGQVATGDGWYAQTDNYQVVGTTNSSGVEPPYHSLYYVQKISA